MQNIKTKITLVLGLALVAFMVSGSSLGSGSAMRAYATTQTLPTCTDPTGQHLRCMMVISTLPPPPNALQCQETSGQFLPCSYTTQNLSNGEQIIAITVYVPTSYVFTGYGSWTVVKQVVHETKTTTKTKLVYECPPSQRLNPETGKCVDVPQCKPGQHLIFVGTFICVPIRPPPPICTPLIPCPPCLEVKPGQNLMNPALRCPTCVDKHDCPIYRPPPTCESTYYTGPCPPTDPNAYTKCESAALLANDNKGELACARLLPDTPENKYTKCESEALIKDDLRAELACAQYLQPINSGASTNLTNTTAGAAATPLSNTSSAIPPNNTSTSTSGGKTSGLTCAAGNCSSGTPPPIDCTKNPTDPSCTQTLTPSTTTPTTKTCPDGSVIDASATCPTQSTPPPTNNNPPPSGNNNPPASTDNNPPPSSSDNGNNNNNNPSSDNGNNDKGSSSSDKSSSGAGGSGVNGG